MRCVWVSGKRAERDMAMAEDQLDLRERSCLLRCSLLLKARAQNWHLYFFSGASDDLRLAAAGEAASAGKSEAAGAGMLVVAGLDDQ